MTFYAKFYFLEKKKNIIILLSAEFAHSTVLTNTKLIAVCKTCHLPILPMLILKAKFKQTFLIFYYNFSEKIRFCIACESSANQVSEKDRKKFNKKKLSATVISALTVNIQF